MEITDYVTIAVNWLKVAITWIRDNLTTLFVNLGISKDFLTLFFLIISLIAGYFYTKRLNTKPFSALAIIPYLIITSLIFLVLMGL